MNKHTKRCSTCGQHKSLVSFNKDNREKSGLRGRCNSCRRQYYLLHREEIAERHQQRHVEIAEYQKRYAQKNRTRHNEHAKEYQLRHPQKYKARQQLQYAVRCGDIIKPDFCSNCGNGGFIEGHHENYNKPYAVVWLCKKCHVETHKERKIA